MNDKEEIKEVKKQTWLSEWQTIMQLITMVAAIGAFVIAYLK